MAKLATFNQLVSDAFRERNEVDRYCRQRLTIEHKGTAFDAFPRLRIWRDV
ncbi:MAG: hypothetical protein ACI822_002660, partial [Gammaproteobacteria bacterium]